MERKIVSFEIVWVTVGDYCRHYGVKSRTVYNRIAKGKLEKEQLAPHYPIRVPIRVMK